MTNKELKDGIDALRFTMDMLLFDPATGQTKEASELNELDKITYDGCIAGITALEKVEAIEKYGLPKIDLTGKRFGKLVAKHFRGMEYVDRPNCSNHYALWECECDCGNVVVRRANNLKIHSTCGCGWKTKNPLLDTSHGAYCSYSNMMARCYNKNNHHYKSYGEKGITVCDRWRHHPQNFMEWALKNGWEDGLTLERIDPYGNYEPSNCKWIPKEEQYKNKRDRAV